MSSNFKLKHLLGIILFIIGIVILFLTADNAEELGNNLIQWLLSQVTIFQITIQLWFGITIGIGFTLGGIKLTFSKN